MSKFYLFNQNNSGGTFVIDENAGIGFCVVVEAENEEQAISRAENIGLYWDGVADEIDCECCGDRWSTYTYEVKDLNTIFYTGYIHYLDGTFKELKND